MLLLAKSWIAYKRILHGNAPWRLFAVITPAARTIRVKHFSGIPRCRASDRAARHAEPDVHRWRIATLVSSVFDSFTMLRARRLSSAFTMN